MAVSKVVLGDETLIDLTGDSVSSENLLQGETAHGANGEEVIGGVVVTPMYTGTKSAIEEAIALGQITEDAVVNITDDEEASSFQAQINEINNRLTHFIKEVGTVSGTATNAEFDVTVTFNKTYQKPPKVLAIANNRSINVAVNSITETDCIIRARYINSGTGAYSIDYFCVE